MTGTKRATRPNSGAEADVHDFSEAECEDPSRRTSKRARVKVEPVPGLLPSIVSYDLGKDAVTAKDPATEQSSCMICFNGSTITSCHFCSLPFCIECVHYDIQVMLFDWVNAQCPRCHYKHHQQDKPNVKYTAYVTPDNEPYYHNGQSTTTKMVMANSLSHSSGGRDGDALHSILIVHIRLQNLPVAANGPGVMANHLSSYFTTSSSNVVVVDLPYDLVDAPKEYQKGITTLVTQMLVDYDFETTFWFLSTRTTSDQLRIWTTHGDEDADDSCSAPISQVYEQLFPSQLSSWLKKSSGRNILIAQTCGGPLRYKGGREAYQSLCATYGFTAAIVFGPDNFSPHFTHRFSLDFGEWYGVHKRPLDLALQDSLVGASRTLGPHSDVHLFTKDEYKIWHWSQIHLKPYGVDRSFMCPECHNLCKLEFQRALFSNSNTVSAVLFKCVAVLAFEVRPAKKGETSRSDGTFTVYCNRIVKCEVPLHRQITKASFSAQTDKNGTWVNFNGRGIWGTV